MNSSLRPAILAALLFTAAGAHAQTTSWSTGAYVYDGGGNIKSIGGEQFRYDAQSRVVSGTAGPGRTQSATYDPYGNITQLTTDGTALSFGVDPLTNRLTNATANVYGTYDGAGRLLTAAGIGNSFSYDGLDTVSRSTVEGVTKVHLYTAADERIASFTFVNGAETRSDWTLRDARGKVLRRLEKVGAQWSWKEDYVYRGSGGLLAAEVDSKAGVLHFYPDHLGTPRLITANGGTKVAFHTYFPFGEEATSASQDTEKLKFTGHERDAASLDYMHARYYAPKWGRFITVDPGSVDLRTPQGWNRYTYVENNPVKNIDPDGKLTNPVTREVGKGQPIVHRGGKFGQIREIQPSVKGSAGGEWQADRAGGRKHNGIDIIAPVGTPLVASFSGRVLEVKKEGDKDSKGKENKLGIAVVVAAKDGTIAIYAHLKEGTVTVKAGDKVAEGQVIGDAGRTGNVMKAQPAEEDHVHMQMQDSKGKKMDPTEFLNSPENQRKYLNLDKKK